MCLALGGVLMISFLFQTRHKTLQMRKLSLHRSGDLLQVTQVLVFIQGVDSKAFSSRLESFLKSDCCRCLQPCSASEKLSEAIEKKMPRVIREK